MIKAIKLVNCQSLENVTYLLATDRLNVIKADNDTGKSVLFKMLKLVGCPKYYTRAERRDLIRRGAQFAAIMFEFTDDTLGMMRVYSDTVVYYFTEGPGAEVVAYSEPPTELLDHVGLLSDVSGDFVANLIDSDQSLLLVDPKVRYNVDLIHMMTSDENLDLLTERVHDLLPRFKNYLSNAYCTADTLEAQLNSIDYVDIKGLEQQFEVSSAAFNVMYALFDVGDALTSFDGFAKSVKDFDGLLILENLLEGLENVGMGKLRTVFEPVPSELVDVLESLETINWFRIPQKPTMKFSDLELLENLEFLLNKIPDGLPKYRSESESLVTVLEKLECVDLDKLHCTQANLNLDSDVEVLELLEKIYDELELVTSGKCLVAKLSKEVAQLKQLFLESGKNVECPLYGKVVFDGEKCLHDSI